MREFVEIWLGIICEYVIGMCDNWFCSRIGLLEVHYRNGDECAYLCVGDCLDWEDE